MRSCRFDRLRRSLLGALTPKGNLIYKTTTKKTQVIKMRTRLSVSLYRAAVMMLERGYSLNEGKSILNETPQPTQGYIYLEDIPSGKIIK